MSALNIRISRKTSALALIALMSTAIPQAHAQKRDFERDRRSGKAVSERMSEHRSSMSKKQRQDKQTASRNITARVIDTKRVRFDQAEEDHLLAKLRLQGQEGETQSTLIADFGPISKLKEQRTSIREGQKVRAQGQEGRLNERPIFLVYAFDLDNQGSRQSGERHKSANFRQIEGKIVAMRDVRIKGLEDDQRLLKLQTNAGNTYIVNTGSNEALDKLALRKGDRARVEGVLGNINEKDVLFATQVAEVVNIDRSREQRQKQYG